MWWVLLLAIAACSSSRGIGPGAPTRGGSGPLSADATACADVRSRVEQLYRAEAEQRESTRVDDAVADNTTMVMNDCAREPAWIAPCLARAGSVAELEQQCLIQLDDEGSEGDLVAR
jgi:hypothetical protein